MADEWWRSAVIYQIYPRSFADTQGLDGSAGDGVGDLNGVTKHLPDLVELGVDAVWISPFMPSPQRDAGYDVADYRNVDPAFGTLHQFDTMLARAHELGIRVIIDLVPNHSSVDHMWFQAALASPPGSRERDRYMFRDGKGPDGAMPPNNWQSVFGGPAWTRVTEADGKPGQWYLHLFDVSQADFNWQNPEVRAEFLDILRFWLDRGVDGFRVDVAHGLVKDPALPDFVNLYSSPSMGGGENAAPYWGQSGVHEIYREWNALLAQYDGERVLCAEAWMSNADETAHWVHDDQMHQAFNFPYLLTPWTQDDMARVIEDSLRAFHGVGAPATWVLSNHDVVRHTTRFGVDHELPQGQGLGPESQETVDWERGLRRARAATMLMLALPGSAYLYQGEELGLPEVIDLPDEARQDPTFLRTEGAVYGRDGCRVPLPWVADDPTFGFSEGGASWLPQPPYWAEYARDVQRADPDSTLNLYRAMLRLRRERGLGTGEPTWDHVPSGDVLSLRNGATRIVVNFGDEPVELDGEVLLTSAELVDGRLPCDATAWLHVPDRAESPRE